MGDGTYPIPRRSDHAPSESVSGVDAIIARLRERENSVAGWWGSDCGYLVPTADAVAAVHATVREIETWLRTGEAVAELYGVVGSRTEPAVNRLTNDEVRYGSASLSALADEVARRFGGTC